MTPTGYSLRFATLLIAITAAAAAVAVAGLLVGYGTASAQSTAAFPGSVIKVNTKVDEANIDGDCSLREAILAANTNAPVDGCKAGSATEQDAIQFALGKKAKTIVLGTQLPTITDPSGLRINGREASITISGNEQVRVFDVAAGAELALSRLTVAKGRSADRGGGLSNGGGTVKVVNTTFSENSADPGPGGAGGFGGGIFNDFGGTLTVTNSTISENSANFRGGGIFNQLGATLTVTNSTISENSAADFGGGIFNFQGSTATLRNTIVAYNTSRTSGGNCESFGATFTDGGYNIDTDGDCVDESVRTSKTTDPLLADQPANNGGPTPTIALLEGSPAINAIPNGTNGCGTEITTDQRGVSRPQGSGCDIGAFEKEGTQ